jgi:hypothetical protein
MHVWDEMEAETAAWQVIRGNGDVRRMISGVMLRGVDDHVRRRSLSGA